MTVHSLDLISEQQTTDVEQVADRVVEKLLSHPTFIDDLATRLAAALHQASPAAPEIAVIDEPEELPDDDAVDLATAELQSWVLCERPELISGDPAVWAAAVVSAATPGRAVPMFKWAFSGPCQSEFWRELSTPISAPRAGRGGSRHGMFAQLHSEFRASNSEDRDASTKIDTVIAGVRAAIAELRVQQFSQQPANARKNALAVLRKHQWDAEEVVSIISWAVRTKPHWRSNISAVPTASTFSKIRGDWITGGSPIQAPITGEQQEIINNLSSGWVYHYSKRQNLEQMQVSRATQEHLRDCLVGSDGADPVPVETIKQFVHWLCQVENRHTTYLVRGVDFPPLTQVRRGLIAMATRSGTSVAATNRGAGGEITSSTVDVSEV